MDMLTRNRSKTLIQILSEASPSTTSSLGLEDGRMPPVSPDGQTNFFSLLEVAPASRSPSQEKDWEPMMSGTFGPTLIGSSKVLDRPSSWESKLAVRLGMLGSTESLLIWKDKATPQGRSIYQLAQSTPRTVETDCTGWPTPTTRDHKGGYRGGRIRNGKISNDTLDVAVQHTATALWPTTAADMTTGVMRSGLLDQTGKLGALNPAFSCWLMGFPQEWESSAPLATPSSRKSRQK